MEIPEGTTHIWIPAIEKPYVFGVYLLAYYKLVNKRWYVYSKFTGWRLSINEKEWFIKERKDKQFITINQFRKHHEHP